MIAGNEYVFRVRAVNGIGESPTGELSDQILASDRRESLRSTSTIGDSESLDYSEYSDYPESEYDPDLDGESYSPESCNSVALFHSSSTPSTYCIDSDVKEVRSLLYAVFYSLCIATI